MAAMQMSSAAMRHHALLAICSCVHHVQLYSKNAAIFSITLVRRRMFALFAMCCYIQYIHYVAIPAICSYIHHMRAAQLYSL